MTPAVRSILLGSGAWTPLALGASLLAWWDAERPDLITQSGGAVSSWRDRVGGYDAVQVVGSAKPTYSATGFNGRAVVTGDGVDDELTLASNVSWLPAGVAPSEDWYVVDQPNLVADAAAHYLGSWGATLNGNSRIASRNVVSGANRAGYRVGDGAASATGYNTIVDFSGRHVMRAIMTTTGSSVEVDGVAGGAVAVVPGTIALRLRFFANSTTIPGVFGKLGINARLVTGALTVQQADLLRAYLTRRL